MKYVSTRGDAPDLGFEEVLLTGLARDGGLYVPDATPRMTDAEILALAGRPYPAVAAKIAEKFAGDAFSLEELTALAERAYRGAFAHPSCAPLVELEPDLFSLELFRGPTLAFKDFAMLFVSQLFEAALARRGRRATIIGATSGDTGSAAIEAFKGLDMVDVFILFPHGRVSEVQRRQMTTPDAPNVHALAIEGDFDACQAAVKAMFNDHAYRDRMGLAAVNSINWARVMAQVVYYFTAAVSLGAPARRVSFSVPTGNFGDIYAGVTAKRMGLPVDRLVIATNANDILHRAMETGRYEVSAVEKTSSPSMDIQVSSNFERALFDASGRDVALVRAQMESLKQSGGFDLSPAQLAALRADFDSARLGEEEVAAEIAGVHRASGYLLDPHSAIGVGAARRVARSEGRAMVCLACAHPAKFPDAVEKASGVRPGLPPHLADLLERPERATVLPNDVDAIKKHIADAGSAG